MMQDQTKEKQFFRSLLVAPTVTSMMKLCICFSCMLWMLQAHKLYAQDLLYSQYTNAPLLINPANAIADYNMSGMIHYRQQFRNPDPAWYSPYVHFILPFTRGIKHKKSGIGISAYLDKASGFPTAQTRSGISFSYAHNLIIGQGLNFSLGAQMGFNTFGFTTSDIRTESQYQNGLGFNSSLSNGETTLNPSNTNFLDLGAGLQIIKEDKNRQNRWYVGISAMHANRPTMNFTNASIVEKLPMRVSIQAGFRIDISTQWSWTPELLVSNQAKYTRISLGSKLSYQLSDTMEKETTKRLLFNGMTLSFVPRYHYNYGLSTGLEIKKGNLFFAISYDILLHDRPERAGNGGAYEVSIGFLKPVIKPKRREPLQEYSLDEIRKFYRPTSVDEIDDYLETRKNEGLEDPSKERDATDTSWANKDTYRFELDKPLPYAANKVQMTNITKKFADEILELMNKHKQLNVLIIGHTDNVGTERTNVVISKSRARIIKEYLIKKGISPQRLKHDGAVETEAKTRGRTPEERAKFKRIKFLIY